MQFCQILATPNFRRLWHGSHSLLPQLYTHVLMVMCAFVNMVSIVEVV